MQQRFTISLDDQLAEQFDQLIARRGYENRSEAVRDLIRQNLNNESGESGESGESTQEAWCIANVSFVFDHHNAPVTARVMDVQHEHHNWVVSSIHTHIDHDNCLETVVLRGPLHDINQFAKKLIALRGVRHGNIHIIPLDVEHHGEGHHMDFGQHLHYKPRS